MVTETPRYEIVEAERVLGESHPLVDQLGSTEGLVALEAATLLLQVQRVQDPRSLKGFLEAYQKFVLLREELPAISSAYYHAKGYRLQELTALDRSMNQWVIAPELASASQRIGQFQLRRFRPMRDQRFIQRYLKAVDQGEAHAWHTLVYGVTLHLYSLPLRQGLFHFARQTHTGFIHCAARRFPMTVAESDRLLAGLMKAVKVELEGFLKDHHPSP